jgi:hypothetical protein
VQTFVFDSVKKQNGEVAKLRISNSVIEISCKMLIKPETDENRVTDLLVWQLIDNR